ncbi:hypothetical protein B9479_008323, partial [Cryptococcus floricola]
MTQVSTAKDGSTNAQSDDGEHSDLEEWEDLPTAADNEERRGSSKKDHAHVDEDDGLEEEAVSVQDISTAAPVVVGEVADGFEFVNAPAASLESDVDSLESDVDSAAAVSQQESVSRESEGRSPREQPDGSRNRAATSSHNTFIDMQSFGQAVQINRDVNPDTNARGSTYIGSRAYGNSLMIS